MSKLGVLIDAQMKHIKVSGHNFPYTEKKCTVCKTYVKKLEALAKKRK